MEKERLLYTITRFDNYYNGINNKCAVFLAVSTFLVGGLITAYPTILEHTNCGWFTHILMSTLIALGVAIMIIVIRASTPYLDSHKKSLLYFGSIATLSANDFRNKSAAETPEAELDDLRGQVHDLACGLKVKFNRLKIAGILFTIQFILFIPLLITLIINLK